MAITAFGIYRLQILKSNICRSKSAARYSWSKRPPVGFYEVPTIVPQEREEMKMMKAISNDNLPLEEDESKWDPIWHLPF